HNITVAPDQASYFVSLAHGTPNGTLWRFDAATDRVLGIADARGYPTTISVTPDGQVAFVANSDFFGERPAINPVTVVSVPSMTTITQLPACDMPHGVKVDREGRTAWVSCMHSDELLAIDVATFRIRTRIPAGGGNQGAHSGHGPPVPGSRPAAVANCSPTFVSITPDGSRLLVACNASGRLQVRSSMDGSLEREVVVGPGAYNVEPSPDGRWVVVTNKKDRSISLVDTDTWTEVARIPTARPVVHGVAWAPDSRRVYVSQESVGAVAGAIDVVDIETRTTIASIAVEGQPTGITILRPRQR
ncbi:MAG TPA: hypothetical protein PLL69_10055, partial [Gemmatimonadales bacterium]|nr:hypothetical protein [Gemmatimonadales bacterium]